MGIYMYIHMWVCVLCTYIFKNYVGLFRLVIMHCHIFNLILQKFAIIFGEYDTLEQVIKHIIGKHFN